MALEDSSELPDWSSDFILENKAQPTIDELAERLIQNGTLLPKTPQTPSRPEIDKESFRHFWRTILEVKEKELPPLKVGSTFWIDFTTLRSVTHSKYKLMGKTEVKIIKDLGASWEVTFKFRGQDQFFQVNKATVYPYEWDAALEKTAGHIQCFIVSVSMLLKKKEASRQENDR